MHPLRVIHFGKFYPPHRGGMETVLATLCRGLVRAGADCQVVVSGHDGDPRVKKDAGVRIRRMRSFGTFSSLSLCPEALWALRGLEVDIINLHHPNPLADVSCLVSRPRARLVVTYHSDIVRQRRLGKLYWPLLHSTLARADAIVATSSEYAASSAVLRQFRSKVHVIPLGLAPPPAGPSTPPFDRGRRSPRYFFLGRLVAYKGLTVLLDALRAVPGRLWIGGSGPMDRRLRVHADRAGVADRVEFLGEISEQEKLLRMGSCDAFVLPSLTRAEAFGLVLLEAMAMARPVVVSDLPTGVRTLVQNGVNGYRFPPGDSRALADVLRRLADDPAAAQRMGEEGRRRFLQRWTMDHMVNRYVRLYEELCASRSAA